MDATVQDRQDPPKWSKNITQLVSLVLDRPPSCIEFLPQLKNTPGFSSHGYFVVGTYDLETEGTGPVDEADDADADADADAEDNSSPPCDSATSPPLSTSSMNPQSRNGSLSLFQFRHHQDEEAHLHLIKRIDTDSAILDLHFMRDSPTFGVVTSTGTISFYRLALGENVTRQPCSQTLADIELIATHCPFKGEAPLILSFDFYRPDAKSLKLDSTIPQPLLLLTTSLGHVWLIRVAHDFQDLEVLNYGNPIIKHGDNAWCCIFAQFNTVFSGGDDSKVRLVYLDPPLYPAPRKNVFTEPLTEAQSVLSGHEAGVTAILELPCPESPDGFVLLTGSFDDHVRVYATHYHPYLAPDTPPKALAKLKIGDGVWRLKFLNEPPLPEDSIAEVNHLATKVKYRILASCMRKGARILEVVRSSSGEWTIGVSAKYCNHQSMNYASDVQPVSIKSALEQDQKRICVTTSFYDKSLCIWKWDPSITVTSQDMAKVEEVVV